MSVIFSPSLLSSNFASLGAECEKLEQAGVKWLHLDVMDGQFVPNITFGAPLIRSVRKLTNMFFDVHLMIEHPENHIDDFINAGADLIVFHIEAARHPQRLLKTIQESGLKAGIALNPGTDLCSVRWLLPDMDLIMLMSVNPGFSGQKFIPQCLKKISSCREFLQNNGYAELPVEVDGGVNLNNTPQLASAGADVLVSGSAFFGAGDFGQALDAFTLAAASASGLSPRACLSWRHGMGVKGQNH